MSKTKLEISENIKNIVINHPGFVLSVYEDTEKQTISITASNAKNKIYHQDYSKSLECLILEAIKSAYKNKIRATLKVIINRRPAIGNFSLDTVNQSLENLINENKIRIIKTETNKIIYEPVKK